jgi:hypothetical protein
MRKHGHAALGLVFSLQEFELAQGAVLAHREFRAYVGCAHTAKRILLRVSYIIGVVTFNVATQRTYLGCKSPGYFTVKHRRVQVGAHFPDDEAGPYILKTNIY